MARLLRHGAASATPPFQQLASGWRQMFLRRYGKRAKELEDVGLNKSIGEPDGDQHAITDVNVRNDAEDEVQVQICPQNNKSSSTDTHEESVEEEQLKDTLIREKRRFNARRSKENSNACADLVCQSNGTAVSKGCDGFDRNSKPTRTNARKQLPVYGVFFQHSSTSSIKDTPSESKLTEHRSREVRHSFVEPLREKMLLADIGEIQNKGLCFIYQVCVRSVPAYINANEVSKALSVYGEIIGFFKKPTGEDSNSVYVQYKTSEAMNKALAAGVLQLADRGFAVIRAKTLNTTVVRLLKVDKHSLNTEIQTICSQFGGIDVIKQHRPGELDVFYCTNELQNIPRILESLNKENIRQNKWMIAVSAPILHPAVRKEVLRTREGQAWHAVQRSQAINRIGFGLDTLSVGFEDLRVLTSLNAL